VDFLQEELFRGFLHDPNPWPHLARVAIRLFVAILLGGILGYERQHEGKTAGLRTHMLVALAAALFALVAIAPDETGKSTSDLSRVIQGVAAGIGFLGAGAILKWGDEHQVRGLTTAAGIWLTAAAGLAAGAGRHVLAFLGVLSAWFILDTIHRMELRAKRRAESKIPPTQ